ncbi:MAG: hypothetical protein GWO41_18205, partial [candidate division Zixibacteria bacterium]|nr:hypothetical protein [candidate division Zixibacteria bacterium]NIT54626.1 hypothetical protein [candidate division Zixibacteria bacterium]NIU17568.1 hypothetical protein [candidate division Zixibacteria bacterium]NIW43147.1 hypothetical protein [candidate division Zixibacteria bacterium]NIX55046.1 hypothetical protein [candidate division Zixibacteria bacterium]
YIPGLDKIVAGNEHHGRCPFCNEIGDPSSPCFWVWSDSQRYRCRKCDAHGDIITYIEEKEGRSLVEQLREAGLLDEKNEQPGAKPQAGKKQNTDSGKQNTDQEKKDSRTHSRTPDEKTFDFIWSQGRDSRIPYEKYLGPTRKIKLDRRSPAIKFNSYKGKDGEQVNVMLLALTRPGDSIKEPQSMMRVFLKKEG